MELPLNGRRRVAEVTRRRFFRFGVGIVCLLLVLAGSAVGQFRRDTSRVTDQEFLRLLQKSEQLNEEQKERARRTRNPRVLMRLARDEDDGVRFYAAFNPFTPAESLVPLASDPNPTIRWGVARNPRFLFFLDTAFVANLDSRASIVEVGREFGRNGIFLSPSAAVEVVSPGAYWKIEDRFRAFEIKRKRLSVNVYNAPVPEQTLRELEGDYAEIVRVGLASNPNMLVGVLEILGGDISPTVRRHVALNENAPGRVLNRLFGDEERAVRLAVAGNPFAPSHILADFSVERDEGIRISVANNPGCSPAVLLGMMFDESIQVRTIIAGHGNLPSPGLVKLSFDDVIEVRRAVVDNPNTVAEALKRLSFDADEDIRGKARTRLAEVLKERIAIDRER